MMVVNAEADGGATFVKPESSRPVEVTLDAANGEVTHAIMSDARSSTMMKYFSGFSYQVHSESSFMSYIPLLLDGCLIIERKRISTYRSRPSDSQRLFR